MRLKICENEIQNGIFPSWHFYDLFQTKKIHYGLHVKAIEITTNYKGTVWIHGFSQSQRTKDISVFAIVAKEMIEQKII